MFALFRRHPWLPLALLALAGAAASVTMVVIASKNAPEIEPAGPATAETPAR